MVTENRESAIRPGPPRLVALTGFMGAGKTTVGRALAKALAWEFVDLDEEIERSEQLRIRELFRRHGEARFREIETAALRNTLRAVSTHTVIALGGGTFPQPSNVALLTHHDTRVIFLEAPVEELFERCAATVSPEENLRPLAADPDAFFALYQRRLPHYRRAHVIVATSGKTAEELAREIAASLG